MKTTSACLFALLASSLFLLSCSEKKKSTDIIAPKPVTIVRHSAPQSMPGFSHTDKVEWLGQEYKVTVKRSSDNNSPTFKDESGKSYYENRLELLIERPDGTEFLKQEFTKNSFQKFVEPQYLAKYTVLGLAVLETEGNSMALLASVGNPDELSDDYVPIKITVSRTGSITMAKSDDLE